MESAIASEGLSLLTVPMAGCMVSFGGYNGRYHNAVHVYRPGVCCLLWSVQLGAGARGSARVVCKGSVVDTRIVHIREPAAAISMPV